MGLFDMLNGNFGKMMEDLAAQLQDSGLLDEAGITPEQISGAVAEAEQRMQESGVTEEELADAAARAQAEFSQDGLSGVDFNNAMIELNEQLQSGGLGDMLNKAFSQVFSDRDEYAEMTAEELAALDDRTLYEAIRARLETEPGPESEYTGAKRVFSVLDRFYQELSEGGLCQYLVNAPDEAPCLPEALIAANAANRAHMLEGFLEDAGLSLDALDEFRCASEQDYSALTEKYPFDDIDDALYDTEPDLETLIGQYARAHLEEFCGGEGA